MNTLQKFILGSIYCNNLTNSSSLNSVISYLKKKIDLDTQFYTKRINDLERHGYIIIKDEFDKANTHSARPDFWRHAFLLAVWTDHVSAMVRLLDRPAGGGRLWRLQAFSKSRTQSTRGRKVHRSRQ